MNWAKSKAPAKGDGFKEAKRGDIPGLQTGFWQAFNWIVSCLANLKMADENGWGNGGKAPDGIDKGEIVIDPGVTEIVAGKNVTLSASRGSGKGKVTIEVEGGGEDSKVKFTGTDATETDEANAFTFESQSQTGRESNVEVTCNGSKITIGVYWV